MHHCYDDILSRIPEEPIWFDEHAVPRYCEFDPKRVANAYADEVALVEVTCQSCGRLFHVAFAACAGVTVSREEWPSGPIATAWGGVCSWPMAADLRHCGKSAVIWVTSTIAPTRSGMIRQRKPSGSRHVGYPRWCRRDLLGMRVSVFDPLLTSARTRCCEAVQLWERWLA